MQRALLMLTLALAGCNLFDASPAAPSEANDSIADGGAADGSSAADTALQPDGMPADVFTEPADMATDDLATTPDLGTDMGIDADGGAEMDMPLDMPPDMSAPDPCTWPDTLFCSGFEDPLLPRWEPFFSMGVTHETAVVRSGTGAARFESPMSEGAVSVATLGAGVGPGETAWLRMFLYVPLAAPPGSGGGIILGSFSTEGGVLAQLIEDQAVAEAFLDMSNTSSDVPFVVPRDQWVCLEAMVTLVDAGELLVAANGTTLIDETNVPLDVMSQLNILGVSGGAPDGSPVYVDDVFVGGSRPGCN